MIMFIHELRGDFIELFSNPCIITPWVLSSSKRRRLLDQRPITLVLMMINSCTYRTNNLVFIKFQIFNQDLSQCLASTKIRSQVLKLSYVDSRARASRSHHVLKRSLALWIKAWSTSRWRRFFRRLESIFVSV